jgi:hypothetical protein
MSAVVAQKGFGLPGGCEKFLALAKRNDPVLRPVNDQQRRRADGMDVIDQVVVSRHAPGCGVLERPREPVAAGCMPGNLCVSSETRIQHDTAEACAQIRPSGQHVAAHAGSQTLTQHKQRLVARRRCGLQPGQSSGNIVEDFRQVRLACGVPVTAVVEQQHLIAGLGQPVNRAQVGTDVLGITVEEQHRAFSRARCFQPPGTQPGSVRRPNFNIAVGDAEVGRGAAPVLVRIKQQATAGADTAETDQQAGQAESPRSNAGTPGQSRCFPVSH